ncbi:MAG: hypothetical protein QF485_00365 [Arenicellales bacterium]|nr:hypothetical protein [Arenicellales bacterium]
MKGIHENLAQQTDGTGIGFKSRIALSHGRHPFGPFNSNGQLIEHKLVTVLLAALLRV